MIRWKSEGEIGSDDLALVLDAFSKLMAYRFRGVGRTANRSKPEEGHKYAENETPESEAGPTVAPDAPWVNPTPGEVPDSDGPVYSQATEEQLAEGADLWMGLLMTWQHGFMEEEADQPDRLGALSEAVTQGGGRMFAALAHYGGLTSLVRSMLPGVDKRRARRIAENVASVSSAAGIPVISDQLEYTKEYLGKDYKHED